MHIGCECGGLVPNILLKNAPSLGDERHQDGTDLDHEMRRLGTVLELASDPEPEPPRLLQIQHEQIRHENCHG
jgi:hypothetical protein